MVKYSIITGMMPSREPHPAQYVGHKFEFKGKFKQIGGALYSVGDYYYNPQLNAVVITELPFRVWTNPYIDTIPESKWIAGVEYGDCTDTQVRIVIRLTPGAIDQIMAIPSMFDGVIEFFNLYTKHYNHINMINMNGGVSCFSSYLDVFKEWYPIRKSMYAARIERVLMLLRFQEEIQSSRVRFIKTGYKLNALRIAQMEALLAADGFKKYNTIYIKRPTREKTEDLPELIYSSKGASYSYLLGLSEIKKSEEYLLKYEEKLRKVQEKLEMYKTKAYSGNFIGANIWLDELDELTKIIQKEFPFGWKSDEVL
jgi:hypothetical protein